VSHQCEALLPLPVHYGGSMRTKTCMCGAKVSVSRRWDYDLDQCIKCTSVIEERIKMNEYLNTFEVGDLLVCREQLCILIEKPVCNELETCAWIILDVESGRKKNLYVSNWLVCGSVRQLKENIWKKD
jgi:hypothetical protein